MGDKTVQVAYFLKWFDKQIKHHHTTHMTCETKTTVNRIRCLHPTLSHLRLAYPRHLSGFLITGTQTILGYGKRDRFICINSKTEYFSIPNNTGILVCM